MKPFNLEEYLENPSRKVVTRDGRPVKIHCTNFYLFNQDIIAEIEGENSSFSFNKCGQLYGSLEECPQDLFFESERKEGWINIFKEGDFYHTFIYNSKEDAEKQGETFYNYVTTIKIEWEE